MPARSMIHAYRFGSWISRTMPWPARLRVADAAADWQWRRSIEDRQRVRMNLAIMLGHPVPDRSPLVREVYRHFARYLLEFVVADRLMPPRLVLAGGDAVVQRVQACSGAIVLSAHVGNWELGAIGLRRLGLPIHAVALPHRDAAVNGFFDAQRRRCGVNVVSVGHGAMARCLDVLRRGEVLAVVADREFGASGVEVSFFGRRTLMPSGPAILSLRSGRPVIPMFLIREGPWRFRFEAETALWPSEIEGAVDHRPYEAWSRTRPRVQALTQRYAAAIERCVGRWPTQWLMFQQMALRGPAVPASAEGSGVPWLERV